MFTLWSKIGSESPEFLSFGFFFLALFMSTDPRISETDLWSNRQVNGVWEFEQSSREGKRLFEITKKIESGPVFACRAKRRICVTVLERMYHSEGVSESMFLCHVF